MIGITESAALGSYAAFEQTDGFDTGNVFIAGVDGELPAIEPHRQRRRNIRHVHDVGGARPLKRSGLPWCVSAMPPSPATRRTRPSKPGMCRSPSTTSTRRRHGSIGYSPRISADRRSICGTQAGVNETGADPARLDEARGADEGFLESYLPFLLHRSYQLLSETFHAGLARCGSRHHGVSNHQFPGGLRALVAATNPGPCIRRATNRIASVHTAGEPGPAHPSRRHGRQAPADLRTHRGWSGSEPAADGGLHGGARRDARQDLRRPSPA